MRLPMQSNATTVDAYLASLPADRRAVLQAVRDVILANLDPQYAEGMQYGMISWFVPHSVFPAGYHCDPQKPLCYAALAAQKNYCALYLMCIYGSPTELQWFQDAWRKTGKKLDMGKSCVRFKTLEDLPLPVVGEAIRRVPAAKYVAHYVNALESGLVGKGRRAAKRAEARAAAKGQIAAKPKAIAKRPVAAKPKVTAKRPAVAKAKVTAKRPAGRAKAHAPRHAAGS